MGKGRKPRPNESMRTRKIKPSIFANEELGLDTADPLLTILFEGLWCMADREGRLVDRPWKIKAKVFPLRSINNPDAMLTWLADHGFIERYEADGGRFIQIVNFLDHQDVHPHEAASVIPANTPVANLSLNVMTTSTNGERCHSYTSLSSLTSLPSSSVLRTGDKAAVDTDPVERRIWNDGLELLERNGTKDPRPLLGRLAKDYGKQLLAECIAATQAENPADPKAFLIKTLKTRKAPAWRDVGKGDDTPCSHCDSARRVVIDGIRRACPECRPEDYAWQVENYPDGNTAAADADRT